MACYISRLPNEILKSIFCRVPIASLIACRHVCKLWHQVLKDLDFGNIHPSTRNPTDVFLCLKNDKLYWFEIHGRRRYHFDLAATVIKKRFWYPFEFVYLNSCKGLLCLCQNYSSMHIINPITSEYINLPPWGDGRILFANLCGLGFDSQIQKFKVVRGTVSDSRSEVEVCTLGDGTWRNISDLPKGDFTIESLGAFFNGSLHCLYWSETNLRMCAFDCQSEKFKQLPLPRSFRDRPLNTGVVSDKWLYVSSYRDREQNFVDVSVWVMKKYGNVKSWTKVLVMENKSFKLDGKMYVKDLHLLGNGSGLLHVPPFVSMFHPHETNCENLQVRGFESTIRPVAYTPSFASLKDAVGESFEVLKANDGTSLKHKSWISPLELCFFFAIFPVIYFLMFK